VTSITELALRAGQAVTVDAQTVFPLTEDQMQAIQAQPMALLRNCESKQSKIINTLATFFSAVEEGFDKAEKYEALARKSDSELAALGLAREDLPRFVMLGHRKGLLEAWNCRDEKLGFTPR
jgi:hypothetical protein